MDMHAALYGDQARETFIKFIDDNSPRVRAFIGQKAVPAIMAFTVAGQGMQYAEYEKQHSSRSFSEIVQEEKRGEADHSMPEPEQIPGPIVAMTLTTATTNTTGDSTMIILNGPIPCSHIRILNDEEKNYLDGFKLQAAQLKSLKL